MSLNTTESQALTRIADALERIANTLEAATGLQEKVATLNQVRAKQLIAAPNTDKGWRKLVAMGDASVWTWPEGEAYLSEDGLVVKLHADEAARLVPLIDTPPPA